MSRGVHDTDARCRVRDDQRPHRDPVLGPALHIYPHLELPHDLNAHARWFLATATWFYAGVAVRLVGLKGLEAEGPTPAEVTFALARVAHEHRSVVADGLDAVGHGRHRIDFASYLSH